MKSLFGFWPFRKGKKDLRITGYAEPITKDPKRFEELILTVARLAPEIRKLMRDQPEEGEIGQATITDGQMIGRMYDFYNNLGSGGVFDAPNNGFIGTTMEGGYPFTVNQDGSQVKPNDKRIAASPKSVLHELETVPLPFTMEGLDEKIKMMEDKSKMSSQMWSKGQIDGMTKRLQNRKKYDDAAKDFYIAFPNTTDEHIDALTKKYKLVMKTTDLFVPTFPAEAINIMKQYEKITKEISGEKPVFYVIAEEADFTKKQKKLDPILLAQSPFGFYWQILGAWDKEMLLLSEL